MILEVADLRVDPDQALAFEAAIAEGLATVIAQAKGYRGHKVNRSQETMGRYLLMIEWETLENHTVNFRGSHAFAKWRGFVGPFFVTPPVVEHFELVTSSN